MKHFKITKDGVEHVVPNFREKAVPEVKEVKGVEGVKAVKAVKEIPATKNKPRIPARKEVVGVDEVLGVKGIPGVPAQTDEEFFAEQYPGWSFEDVDVTEYVRVGMLKKVCSDTISKVYPTNSCMRITSAKVFGQLSDTDNTTATDLAAWVEDMITTCRNAVENGNEPIWPEPTSAMIDLIQKY